ncbi:hypothetical protein KFK09_011229 [Dendrobium nobile]|uniref:Uncharacterized protein n=1 Tax=Dendrobium nobile TaxID=94219 RepID=A0A8T3BF49_DENNO|nr:hypothetical protein KFK09_011229 [Dendrobium nobile]
MVPSSRAVMIPCLLSQRSPSPLLSTENLAVSWRLLPTEGEIGTALPARSGQGGGAGVTHARVSVKAEAASAWPEDGGVGRLRREDGRSRRRFGSVGEFGLASSSEKEAHSAVWRRCGRRWRSSVVERWHRKFPELFFSLSLRFLERDSLNERTREDFMS